MSLEQAKSKFAHAGNEAAVIACVLKDPTNYYAVETKLSDGDFLTAHHRAIWTIIKALISQGVISIDVSSILNQATSLKIDDRIGGYDYINALFEKSVDPANIDFYIQRLIDASTKFKILQTTQEIEQLTEKNKTLTGETLTATTLVEHAQNQFLQIALETEKGTDAENLGEGLRELIADVQTQPLVGLRTDFEILDSAINGLEFGTLTVLGARPKTGKSAFLMNVAKHVAFSVRLPVLYIDTEMNSRQQKLRLLSNLSGVPERDIKTGVYHKVPEHVIAVNQAIEISESGLIFHKYYPDFTAEGVAALTRKYHHQYGVGLVVFDYIKLPDSDLQLIGKVQEHQALGFLCVSLKNLAGQLDIPVLAAAQIGRGGANKGHVTASDFADSDRILRYADTLLGLSAKTRKEIQELEEKYGRDQVLEMGTHRLQILETRAGGTDFSGIDIYFRQKLIKMSEARVQLSQLQSDGEEDLDES